MDIPENFIRTVSVALAGVVGGWFAFYLRNAAQRPAKIDKHGRFAEISYPAGYKVLAWGCLALGIGVLLLVGFFHPPQRGAEVILVLVVFSIFLLGGGLLLMETNTKIVLSRMGIRLHSPWTKDRFIRWEDVVEVSYSGRKGRFTIKGKQGEKIHVREEFGGLPTLVEAFHAMLPPIVYHQAVFEYWNMPAVEPKNPVISLANDTITFDTRGWRTFEDQPYRRVLTNDDGDVLRLHLIEDPPKLSAKPAEIDALRDHFRHLLANEDGAFISLDSFDADGVPAIKLIARYQHERRPLVYVGSFIIPFRDLHYVVRILCRESDLTGYREAIVFDMLQREDQLLADGTGTVKGWQADPYDPTFRAPFLRNRSEDEQYDAMFPEHPLSRLRQYVRDIETTLRLSPAVKQVPPFTGTAHHHL